MATLVKVTKQFDYFVPGVKMTSYSPDGGEFGDGFHDMPSHHLEAARAAGALDEDAQPPVRKDPTDSDTAVVKVAGGKAK